jgi:hypothetical protein
VQALAEVISSSITSIVAECDQRSLQKESISRPRFGGFVSIESQTSDMRFLAVVYNITTEPGDNVHKTVPFGMTREQLQKEQPQIFFLLQTQIHAVIIGFISNKKGFAYLPPQPPNLHEFVYPATKNDLEMIADNFDFLRLLSEVKLVASDELIAAAVRESFLIHNKSNDLLLKAGQALAQLFSKSFR